MIKRNSVWIVFLLMLFSIGSITTNRTEAKSKNEFSYKKEGKTITITKYNGNKKNIVVPDKIKGKKVAAISVGAFSKSSDNLFAPRHPSSSSAVKITVGLRPDLMICTIE